MNGRRAALPGVALLLLCLAVAACGGGSSDSTTATPSSSPTRSASPQPSLSPSPTEPATSEAPARDLLDLARRYRGYPYDGPRVARSQPFEYEIGDLEAFTLLDLDQLDAYTVDASLQAITEHAYFFVEEGSGYTGLPLDQYAEDFESIVWPTVTESFGEPWTPGVDGDPRITILHASLRGVGGYVSGSDSYPKAVAPSSAEREMLYIEVTSLDSPGAYYNALVAHELQHLVHQHGDQNEDAWVNEGLSEVAWEMAGGGADGVLDYLDQPDTQLNFWPFEGDPGIHYSLSELFFGYVLDQYGGRDNARQLVDIAENGITGVERYISPARIGQTFEDLYAAFAIACYLDENDGPYSLAQIDATITDMRTVSGASGSGTVSQFGTDYLEVPAGAGSTFRFEGAGETTVGVPEHDGAFWWSGRGDGLNPRLTREVDLTDVDTATLTFDAWWDIEPGWDFAYVAASTDDGRTWVALPGTSTTTDDPLQASYGPGYTGNSNWTNETVDLSGYAGEQILLRFEYVTDDSTSLTGFAVDNVSIPEIGMRDGADDATDWASEGFRRVDEPLPQVFIVQMVDADGTVTRIELDPDNAAEVPLGGQAAVFAVSGATRDTAEKASYRWTLLQ